MRRGTHDLERPWIPPGSVRFELSWAVGFVAAAALLRIVARPVYEVLVGPLVVLALVFGSLALSAWREKRRLEGEGRVLDPELFHGDTFD